MPAFITRKIVSNQTVPETLRQAREKLDEELANIAKSLNIQVKHLLALEEGAYEKIPGEIYAKQWLRAYGKYLDLDVKWLIKEYQHEKGVQLQFSGFDRPEFKTTNWLSWLNPKTLKFASIILITLALVAYLGLEIVNILQPPTLVIYEPQNNIITEQRLINVAGQTDPEIELTINNEVILADESGFFNKKINLSPGLNILEVVATKKHGAKSKTTISIYRTTIQVEKKNTSISIYQSGS